MAVEKEQHIIIIIKRIHFFMRFIIIAQQL